MLRLITSRVDTEGIQGKNSFYILINFHLFIEVVCFK